MTYRKNPRIALLAATALAMPLAALPATAQSTTASTAARTYDIPAQPLNAALQAFGEASGLQLVYDPAITAGRRSSATTGSLSSRDALSRLLAGTGLTFTFSSDRAVVIAASSIDGVRALGPVRVEGTAGSGGGGIGTAVSGINGSADANATEGTGSYTTGAASVASKTAEALKDTPASVSVITKQRLEDQNLTDLRGALTQMTGVTALQAGSNLDTSYYSRGFILESFQIDGGAPISAGFGYKPLVDLANYDSVQIVRGSAGLFNGYGDPGGIVNLVRKKPLDHNQVIVELQAGSWNDYRQMLDVTGPLTDDGTLRARAVFSNRSNDYFYDVANNRLTTVNGTLDYDLTPQTRLTGGISYSRQNAIPFFGGLPRFSDGASLDLPRRTFLGATWNRSAIETTEMFAEINHRFSEGWKAKLAYNHNDQNSSSRYLALEGAIDPVTRTGSEAQIGRYDALSNQDTVELTVNGAFRLLGGDHTILIGANYQSVNADGTPNFPLVTIQLVDLFTFDPAAIPEQGVGDAFFEASGYGQSQLGIYATLNIELLDSLHLRTGVRYSRFTYTNVTSIPSFDLEITESFKSSEFSNPNGSLTYDITKNLSVYASYATIFRSQGSLVTADGKTLQPVTGDNIEGGIKWQSPDERLNVALTAYTITQKNFAVFDPDASPGASSAPPYCCYLAGSDSRDRSRGFDLEVTGELRPQWQVSFGYSFNDNKTENKGQESRPLQTRQPKHLVKMFTSYRFTKGAWLDRLTVGGGVDYRSRGYAAGSACTGYTDSDGEVQPFCPFENIVPFDYVIRPYATASLFVDYRLSDRFSIGVNGTNIFDKRTYSTLSGSTTGGNWYIQPAAVTGTLRARW